MLNYFLLIFFLIIILSSFVNYSITDEKFIRSLIFLKYLLFAIIVKKLVEEKKVVNIKHFIYVAAASSLIVSLSVLIEWIIDFRIDEFLLYGDAYQKCSGKVLSSGILDLTESCFKK